MKKHFRPIPLALGIFSIAMGFLLLSSCVIAAAEAAAFGLAVMQAQNHLEESLGDPHFVLADSLLLAIRGKQWTTDNVDSAILSCPLAAEHL